MKQAQRAIDGDLETLACAKHAWARLSIPLKLAMLRTVKRNVYRIAPEWVADAVRAKGLEPESPLAGEEWISGPWAVLYALTRYVRTLETIEARGEPALPRMHAAGDRIVVDVFPRDLYDRALLTGVRAEVWMQRGLNEQAVRARAGSFYRNRDPRGKVALVLGAGNIASIAPLDVLYKLVAEGAVCMLKMNPVNAYLQPYFERAFEPFVQAGFLRFAAGGAETGAYLCSHAAVDEVHITGSEQTYKTIVREAAGKRITSELGNVSPTIVVPGAWSKADLRYQAAHIATQKAHNAGFNCIASQVLLLPRDWEHTRGLKAAVADALENMEDRPEYYPGAAARRTLLAGPDAPLRTLLDIDPSAFDAPALTTEAFCGVLACVELPGDAEDFLEAAVAFANTRLHGTLGAGLIAAPATIRNHREAFANAIEHLRYGSIGVNAWNGVGYFLNETPWGAYPGHTAHDPGSGSGVVHNAFLLEGSEKSVVYAPFRSLPTPPWFITNTAAAQTGRALCDFEMYRSPVTLAQVALSALHGV